MIYGELGITLLNLSIGNRILNFWARIVNGKPDQISVILYKLAYERHKRNIYQSPWITYVKSSLDRIGLSDNWLSQTVNNIYTFKTRVKSVLHDNFTQSWKSKIFESLKCINHRIYKDTFKFEGYLNLLPFSLAKVMCSHETPAVAFSSATPFLIDSNQLDDEYPYIFQCNFFAADRHKYLPTFCRQAVNTYKYACLMNSTDPNVLKKLALFLKSIMSKFQ